MASLCYYLFPEMNKKSKNDVSPLVHSGSWTSYLIEINSPIRNEYQFSYLVMVLFSY